MSENNLKTVNRFDRGATAQVTRLDNGFMRLTGTVGRVGVLTYRNADGSERRELRHPDEVFHPDSLESLKMMPVTLDHPSESMVDSENVNRFQVGTVGDNPERLGGDRLGVGMMITHDKALKAIDEEGLRELSPGYTVELDFTPGVFKGERYDAVQRKIRYNHIAIVPKGRAGSTVRLHLDSAVEVSGDEPKTLTQDTKPMSELVKINLDSVDYEVDPQVKQAIDAFIAKQGEELEALKAELSKESARADAAAAELTKEQEALNVLKEELPELVKQGVEARLVIERLAADILGEENISELANDEIKKAVVSKVNPEIGEKLDSADPAYLEASFDFAVASHKSRPNENLGKARVDAETKTEEPKNYADIYAEKAANAWRNS